MSAANLLGRQNARLRGMYRGWWIVLIGHYTQAVIHGAGGWVFGAVLVAMQNDLGWSQKTLVGVLTINRVMGGVLSVPLGPFVDRHGARMLMTVSSLITGLAMIAVAFTNSVVWFYVAWIVFGLGLPGTNLLGPRVTIANWFVKQRPKALVLFSLGSATAGIILVPIAAWITVNYSWRFVWVLLGVLALAITPAIWALIRRVPEDVGLLPDGEDPRTAIRDESGHAVVHGADRPWTVAEALRTRAFWLTSFGFLLVSMPSGTIFINISGFAQSRGFDVATGATVVSAYGFGVLAGRPVWGFFLTRYGTHATMYIYAALYATAIFGFTLSQELITMYFATLWLGAAIAAGNVLQGQVLPEYFGRRIVGTLTGYSQLPNTAIAGMAPLVTAAIYDATKHYEPAFFMFVVGCLVASVVFFFAPPPVHPSERGGAAVA